MHIQGGDKHFHTQGQTTIFTKGVGQTFFHQGGKGQTFYTRWGVGQRFYVGNGGDIADVDGEEDMSEFLGANKALKFQ